MLASPAPASTPLSSPPRRRAILLVLVLAFFFSPLDYSILEPVMPRIQAEFEIGRVTVSWVLIVFSMALMLGAPLVAKLSDVLGRRRAFVLTLAALALGSLVSALAPSYAVLLLGRALQGFGAGGIAPIMAAIVGDVFPAGVRGRVLGLMGVVVGIGLLLGAVVGELSARLGWRPLFLISVPALAILAIAGWWLIPDGQRRSLRHTDWPGLAVLIAIVALLLYGLTTRSHGWPYIAVAVLLLPIFWRVEQQQADPLVPPDLLRSREMCIAGLIAVGAGVARTILIALPELAARARGTGVTATADVLLPLAVAIVGGALISGAVVDRAGSRVVLVAGLALVGLATLGSVRWRGSVAPVMLASVAYGLGVATLVGAPVRHMFLAGAPPPDRGAAQGVFAMLWALGQELSAVAVADDRVLAGTGVGALPVALAMLAGLMLLLAVCAIGLDGRGPELTLEPAGSMDPNDAIARRHV